MKIINARLRRQEALFTLDLQDGMIHRITAQAAMQTADAGDIDARGRLAIPPFVEPHIHLDATLTAGEPEWNRSGTLFEGITRWSQRKASITPEDTRQRALKTIGMLRDFGVQHVRTHVDVTDPSLAALQALLAVKQEAADLIDLQIVAFPQEGIESYPNGRELMTRAIEMGADVVGGIPHYENTRDKGVSSVMFLMDLAQRYGRLVDVHCDEIDDPQSRFLEVLAEEARVRWQTFIAMTLAYVTCYVCRLSFTVAKSALVELGITPTELGMIGSTLFFSYAIGKLVNGFIADHANVVRYMSLGLLLSAGMNLMMGMTTNALLLAIFWGINGWAQSMGVGPCAVSLARWYGVKERGTFYGIWSTAHNIGEAVTYMVIAAVIAGFGWQMGYLSTAALGAAGVVLLVLFMHDSPQSSGFPSINVIRDEPQEEVEARGSVFKNQLLALRNPALWTLALASAFMYIDRYAVNSWGIFFLEQDKAYSTLEASGIIGVNAIAGIAGTIIAGMLSDRFFPRNRSVMAGFISLLNTAGFALMLWSPHNYYTDILAMIIFGATIGALTCFLGGLIAVDISSRKAAGAALGTIGIASYAGAGLGEFLTGIIIDKTAILENGKTLYDFSTLALFWVGTGLGSALLCFTTAAIVARRHAVERQTSFSS